MNDALCTSAVITARAAVVGLVKRLGLAPEELNLDLGPLGRLLWARRLR